MKKRSAATPTTGSATSPRRGAGRQAKRGKQVLDDESTPSPAEMAKVKKETKVKVSTASKFIVPNVITRPNGTSWKISVNNLKATYCREDAKRWGENLRKRLKQQKSSGREDGVDPTGDVSVAGEGANESAGVDGGIVDAGTDINIPVKKGKKEPRKDVPLLRLGYIDGVQSILLRGKARLS